MPVASASGTDASSAGARNREHNQGNQERKYTVEQKRAVLRIRSCKSTAFYEILEIQKTCTDAEVKKAYRKQSLLTHPDKNGHEHADEAFKMVSRAFSILGDKEKRDKFDRFGTDPDSRFQSQPQQNPFAGNVGEDISPEEMFARFFGGGGGFDGGPQFVFNFGGGPGVRVHQFGGARPRARPRNPGQPEETSLFSTIMGLLPILLLFIFPLLSSMFSGGTSQSSTPSMVFDHPHPPLYTLERTMPTFGSKYYLNPQEVQSFTQSKLHTLDKKAEVILIQQLRLKCEDEIAHRDKLREAAQGWFYQNPEKMEVANSFDMPACRRMKSLPGV
ncbi:DnaJ domain-containing protein [Lasiosphaeris hirsuta]|uniref:DnaJ domain-containing protein n=1 Tax=Lasiosphaeris hirsuta TaxID=260670 RepID=A0AA40DIK0_9PEZI|nr:DnaJ domain-containing protein [Lasiosphaeris hirsuta]